MGSRQPRCAAILKQRAKRQEQIERVNSAAARKRNMSYQSAANHVRRLEQLIGERLVKSDQGAKTVTRTGRGSSLYKLLQPQLETILARLSVIIDKERPIIGTGLPQAFFFHLLPEILTALYEIHPDVEILAYERDTILADLKPGQMLRNLALDFLRGEGEEPRHDAVPPWWAHWIPGQARHDKPNCIGAWRRGPQACPALTRSRQACNSGSV